MDREEINELFTKCEDCSNKEGFGICSLYLESRELIQEYGDSFKDGGVEFLKSIPEQCKHYK